MGSGVAVEAERQTHSRELVGAAMCVAPARAVPRAGAVGALVVAVAAVEAAVAVAAVEAAVAAGVDEVGT